MFHTYVAYVCNGFQVFSGVFVSVSDTCFQVIHLSFFMLQLLHLDVSKIDRVLHMGCPSEMAGGAGDVRGGAGPLLGHLLARCVGAIGTLPLRIRRTGASKFLFLYR